ncbi:hypothetical protein HPB49_026444 [Dermacentor silvarum]|nr:hypothetical protein HPB49_026444 [Dermacentor silvarum]
MLRADGYEILSARMLGRLILDIIYFHSPHFPFYVKVEAAQIRCRPYQKTVQLCKTFGDLGHRQDIYAQPKPYFCYKSSQGNQPAEHKCKPICKICNLPHETAGKDCKKKLKPAPLPYMLDTRTSTCDIVSAFGEDHADSIVRRDPSDMAARSCDGDDNGAETVGGSSDEGRRVDRECQETVPCADKASQCTLDTCARYDEMYREHERRMEVLRLLNDIYREMLNESAGNSSE